ncbi:MAG: putative membrane-bound dehydrogenase-like protein, partial [Kiritimatiellia bacterium]
MIRPLIVLAITASSLFAQNSLKDIPDPNPDVQLSSFKVADGFKIELFAADPMIAKPVQMNWDEQGRLWVVSSRIYPHIIPGQAAEDQVIVLEDTDGDGRADTSTVFADKLLVPTAIIPGDGGAYVGNSTELLHMKDTDGDGKADHTRVVLSGFGTEDTHHILHTLRWGMDGDLYMNQSIYIHSHIETPHGPRRLLAGGVWRFRPETMELEVFNRGLINSWGHDFNRWGQSFQTDGAGGDGINYVFPGTVMATAHSAARIVRGLNPGQPKQCGLCVVSGKHFPDAWQDRLIT